MSFSTDGFWQTVLAYEPPLCACCEARVAAHQHEYCSRCDWNVQAEVTDGWPELRSYLSNWAAFSDWEAFVRHASNLPD